MTTETIEKTETAAEQRKAKAVEQLQKLTTEQETLTTRKQAAGPELVRLQDEIAKAERAGAEAKTLAALRKDRTDQEQVSGDLDRVLSIIEQELVPARAELRAAEIAVHAEKYNELVVRQVSLTGVIDEAIHTIIETIKVKEGLARKQDAIHGDAGRAYPELSPAGIRYALEGAITKRLQAIETTEKVPPFSRLDWSCRQMSDQGDLLPIENGA